MDKDLAPLLPEQLRALRERAGLSRDALAKAIGLKGASSYQRYESADYRKKYIPVMLAELIAHALEGKGTPPIQQAEVLQLAGVRPTTPSEKQRHLSSYVKDSDQETESDEAELFIEADWRPFADEIATPERAKEIEALKTSNIIKRDTLQLVFDVVKNMDAKSIDMDKLPLDVVMTACIATHDVIATSNITEKPALIDLARSSFIKIAHMLVIMNLGLFDEAYGGPVKDPIKPKSVKP
ncbi:helix-turn-helix domain-containing protein [Azospirillum sp. YIM B02556]|uniref:Helix-turn-helix domain-containing protein n=1 Tax=Azospirillum endophyticum TaxID=2800326 RepID=A0ABS1F3M7_9PROT|nr:helix-turn-helix transcriptional regulator [Azospirillum endophyticum]MBK1837991.1 helix-turn-helix domain-containing protein [Azospirillum endophyticum]